MAINEASLINEAINCNLMTSNQVTEARQAARREHLPLMEVLCRDHRLPETAFYQAVARRRHIPYLSLSEITVDQGLFDRLPSNLLLRRLALPVITPSGELLLALADPDDQVVIDSVRRVINKPLQTALAEPISLLSVLQRYVVEANTEDDLDPVKLFDDLMKDAYVRRASDIHLEPSRDGMRVRMRVDGQLMPYPKLLNLTESSQLVNRIKVLSQLDIAEQRLPQDGGFTHVISDWQLSGTDLRVATLPSRWGERVTLRILGQEDSALGLSELGMEPKALTLFRNVLNSPHGMVLVTGPTGSGKSTTLYAALRELDRNKFNILTVEDPIEQMLDDVTQVQISTKTNFATALRSFLRHDPDIILVGEIRDKDTAETAMKAAMTGHLVLSTLHTNDATSAIDRMVNIGCEAFLTGSTVRMVIGQRLVRRLCKACKEPAEDVPMSMVELANATYYQAKGCAACLGTGYSGRVGLYEFFSVNDRMTQLINQGETSHELRRQAGAALHSLWQDAQIKAAAGETSLEEILPFQEMDEGAEA